MAQIFTGTDPQSLAVDIMARYTRVIDSEMVKITQITPEQQAVLGIESLPCMIVTDRWKYHPDFLSKLIVYMKKIILYSMNTINLKFSIMFKILKINNELLIGFL